MFLTLSHLSSPLFFVFETEFRSVAWPGKEGAAYAGLELCRPVAAASQVLGL